jgi:hypothetical protein
MRQRYQLFLRFQLLVEREGLLCLLFLLCMRACFRLLIVLVWNVLIQIDVLLLLLLVTLLRVVRFLYS